MTVSRSVAEVLQEHVTLEIDSIDRLYLNLYVPRLQRPEGVAWFWTAHRGHRFASSALMEPMSRAFRAAIEAFAQVEGVEIVEFRKRERKEEVARKWLAKFPGEEGVLFIGKAQEKVSVVRTERRRNPKTGAPYPWLVRSTAMVNQYYFYCVDRDFGLFFLKLGSYFPYTGKLCLNGHEYLKRQLAQRGIPFEALENGLLSCTDPARAQRLADGLTAPVLERLARKWLRRLPHPYTAQDRRAGYGYELSILQAEFSLTQVLDRPMTGRMFFERVIGEHLDLGRPDQVQLLFGRRVTRRTPGRFRTRILSDGVIPSLHIDYKHSRIKQYHKQGRALRTETTVNDTRDFAVGRRLQNLSALRKIGQQANRRLLDVQRTSHDPWLGEATFRQLHAPVLVGQQRAAALRFGDPRVLALLQAIVLFRHLPRGFANRDLRIHLAAALGKDPAHLTAGQLTYDLRRLRLHGLIERLPKTHRYNLTSFGFECAVVLLRAYARLLQPGLSLLPITSRRPSHLQAAIRQLDSALEKLCA